MYKKLPNGDFVPMDSGEVKSAVVLFSGGVESTATLEWASHQNYDVLLCVHSMWHDMEVSGSRELNPNVEKICEYYNVPLYTYTHTDPLNDFSYDGIQKINYVHSSYHWLNTAMNIAARYPKMKEFLWGVNCGINKPGDGGDYHFLPRSWQFAIAFDQYTNNMGRTDQQKLYPPVAHMTKKQMWESIPDEVKPLVQSCGDPLKYDGNSPCGKCYKCKEMAMIEGI